MSGHQPESVDTSGDDDRTRVLHEQAIVIDGACPLMRQPERWSDWIRGGVTLALPTVASSETSQSAMAKIAQWYRFLREHPDEITLVTHIDDIARAKREARLGVAFHFQDTLPLELNIDLLEVYQRLGVRMIQLCYNQRNFVGDGCSESADAGLSSFGVKVIREMERLGIVVDLSHTGYRTTMDALEIVARPPVFSHSNSRALCNNRRNIWDDQIRRVAERSGLVGVTGFPAFVKRGSQPSLADFVAHIDYIVQLVGIDYVGLALDYYGQGSTVDYQAAVASGRWDPTDYPPPPHVYPGGIEDASGFPNITCELLRRGYEANDVLKILGGNWLRIFRATWET